MSKLKMVKVEYESDWKTVSVYVDPDEVSSVMKASYDPRINRSTWTSLLNDPENAKSKIVMRNRTVVYSGKEPDELVAEIEAAANSGKEDE